MRPLVEGERLVECDAMISTESSVGICLGLLFDGFAAISPRDGASLQVGCTGGFPIRNSENYYGPRSHRAFGLEAIDVHPTRQAGKLKIRVVSSCRLPAVYQRSYLTSETIEKSKLDVHFPWERIR